MKRLCVIVLGIFLAIASPRITKAQADHTLSSQNITPTPVSDGGLTNCGTVTQGQLGPRAGDDYPQPALFSSSGSNVALPNGGQMDLDIGDWSQNVVFTVDIPVGLSSPYVLGPGGDFDITATGCGQKGSLAHLTIGPDSAGVYLLKVSYYNSPPGLPLEGPFEYGLIINVETDINPNMNCLGGPSEEVAASTADLVLIGGYFDQQVRLQRYPAAVTIGSGAAFGGQIAASSRALGRAVSVYAGSHGNTDVWCAAGGCDPMLTGNNAEVAALIAAAGAGTTASITFDSCCTAKGFAYRADVPAYAVNVLSSLSAGLGGIPVCGRRHFTYRMTRRGVFTEGITRGDTLVCAP